MENTKSGGISLLGLLGVVFVTLKLTGYINWSWWWVLLPFWGGIGLVLVRIVLIFVLSILKVILKSIFE